MGGTCTTPESDKKATLITPKSSGGNRKQAKSEEVDKYKNFQNLGSLYDECTSDGRSIQCVVTQKDFEANFKSSFYYKCYKNASTRYPDLKTAIKEICKLAPKNEMQFMKYYEEYEDEPAKVVTLIWTYEPLKLGEMKIYQLINIATIIDAMNTFDDVNCSLELDGKYSLKSLLNDAKYVIKQSFNFLRLLNSYVVDKGPSYNTKDRVVYYGTPFKFLKSPEEGQVYRIITWFCCQENEKDAGKNTSTSCSDNSFLSLTVPEGCLNAAKI